MGQTIRNLRLWFIKRAHRGTLLNRLCSCIALIHTSNAVCRCKIEKEPLFVLFIVGILIRAISVREQSFDLGKISRIFLSLVKKINFPKKITANLSLLAPVLPFPRHFLFQEAPLFQIDLHITIDYLVTNINYYSQKIYSTQKNKEFAFWLNWQYCQIIIACDKLIYNYCSKFASSHFVLGIPLWSVERAGRTKGAGGAIGSPRFWQISKQDLCCQLKLYYCMLKCVLRRHFLGIKMKQWKFWAQLIWVVFEVPCQFQVKWPVWK